MSRDLPTSTEKPFPRDTGRITLGTKMDRDRRMLYSFTLATGDRVSVAAFSPEEALEIAKTSAASRGTVVVSTT